MKTKKKMNTYVKLLLLLLAGAVVGGIVGAASAMVSFQPVGSGMEGIIGFIRSQLLPVMIFLTVALIFGGEYTLSTMERLGKDLEEAEEDYEEREEAYEKIGSNGMIYHTILSVLSLLLLSTGYSMDYMEQLQKIELIFLLITFGVFLLQSIYQGIWQVRYVKLVQKLNPDRFGSEDPTSRKFQEQWLSSCDEAERTQIYQAAYKSYILVSKILPMLTVAAMLCHMFWNTGIMAVFVLCVVWLITTVTYCRNCRKKEKRERQS